MTTPSDTEPRYASAARPWLRFYKQQYIEQALPECTAFAYICEQNKSRLSETALEYYGHRVSYAEWIVNVKHTAAALRAAGVKKGDIITLVSVATPEVVYLFYAADLIGATLNLIDPRYSADGIHNYIEEVQSRLLICLNVAYERCRQASKHSAVEKVVVFSPADSLPAPLRLAYRLKSPDKNRYASNVTLWHEFLAAGQGQSTTAEPYDSQHACVIVHTGGTTGSPKGVMLSDANFNSIAQQFSAYDTLFRPGQTLMDVLPPFVAYGYACGVHLPLALGLRVVIIPNLDPTKLGGLVRKYRPEHMFSVPTYYQQMALSGKLKRKNLSFIRNYAAGGDSMSLGAEQMVNDFLTSHGAEFPLAKGYGMTEVCSAATVAAGRLNKPGSVGVPMVNTLISVFEPNTDTELPLGARGEICISGPSVMLGYYQKSEETDNILRRHRDGRIWVHTGDLGYMDEDGYLYLDSRIKRLIIRHDGLKVFPSMIENAISRHPAVRSCSAVGFADKDHLQGRLPFVYLVLDPDAGKKKRQIVRELRTLCQEELPEYMQPAGYKFLEKLPYTLAGKVDYRKLEEDLAAKEH